jgi:hypothetical protein
MITIKVNICNKIIFLISGIEIVLNFSCKKDNPRDKYSTFE